MYISLEEHFETIPPTLDEWHDFCHMIEDLPYAKELIIGEE